ncbi:hypothetical protein D3C80_1769260 [compost metagenome]
MVQNNGIEAYNPTAATLKVTSPGTNCPGTQVQATKAQAASTMQLARCQRRSPTASECLPITIIPTPPARYGTVVSRPVCKGSVTP